MINIKYAAIACIISLLLGGAVGYFALPAKIITKTEIKEVIKTVTDTKQQEHKNVITKITEITDCTTGQKTVVTEIIDKSETLTDSQTKSDTDKTSNTYSSKEYAKNTLFISVLASSNIWQTKSLDNHIDLGIHAQKRILGPIYLGVFGFSDKRIGVSLGITF